MLHRVGGVGLGLALTLALVPMGAVGAETNGTGQSGDVAGQSANGIGQSGAKVRNSRPSGISSPIAPAPTPAPASRPASAPSNADVVTLDLYTLTDVHGHIEKVTKKDRKTGQVKVLDAGLEAMGCYLEKARATHPDSSFTLLGDNIGASPFTSGVLLDNPTIEALNELTPVASTIGNHELDMGQAVFKQRVDGSNATVYSKVGFPYLGVNVKGMGTWNDGGVEKPYLGDAQLWRSPSGVTVAFIGAIAEDVPYKLSPGTTEGLTFEDPIAHINSLASSLKAQKKADIVIAMLDDDVKNNYPKMGPDVDGIMGGDTHVPYEFDQINSTEKLSSANPKLAGVASGSYTDNLGLLRIAFDKSTKKVVSADSILTPASEVVKCDVSASPVAGKVKAIVDRAVAQSKVAGQKVIASGIQHEFRRGVFTDPSGATAPGSNRGIESTLGDLVADAMKNEILTREGKPVDIGIINAGGLRADLIPVNGEVTYAQTYEVNPFSNEVGYVTLSGANVRKALEEQWKTDLGTQNSRPLLKLGLSSNVRYTYDPAKPFGQRITSVTVDGKPLDDARMYTVGSSTFLLQGGDTFPALTVGNTLKTSGNLDRDTFNAYLSKLSAAGTPAQPRAAKSSIGLTAPEGPFEPGATVALDLRGLSFSEGPYMASSVKVRIGGEWVTATVDSSLRDEKANSEEGIITTDGAGRASLKVPLKASCPAEGGTVRVPIEVATDHATVVPADQGLTVSVTCPKTQGPKQETQPPAAAPAPSGKTTPAGKSPLASTGAPLGVTLLVVAMLGACGALMVSVRRS